MMEKEVITSPLINKKVTIYPVKRQGGWLPPEHDGSFLLTGAKVKFKGVPWDSGTRRRIDPLTDEEKAWFYLHGNELGIEAGDLSIHKEKNFWSKFKIELTKEPFILDLSDPMDYLRYTFLKAQKDIVAPTWKERLDKGTYRFAVRDFEVETSDNVKKIAKEKEVNRYFYKIENDEHKLRALLKMYLYSKNMKKKVPSDVNINYLTSEVYDIIKNDIDRVYDIVTDKSFETKLLIYESIDNGKIEKISGSEYRIVGEEDVLNMKELISFLEDKKNQPTKIKLVVESEK